MRRLLLVGLTLAALGATLAPAGPAQAQRAAASGAPEIKLDEPTTLKAAALEARMSAIVANFALLQRQAQDLQHELKQILDDRKKLIEEAAKKNRVEVGDANEWVFENKGQRYLKLKKTP